MTARAAFLSLVAVACLLVVGQPRPAFAATYEVDTTSDGDLMGCTTASADCSLRGAINKANSVSGTDVINFSIPRNDPGCNVTTGVCTIAPTSALPTIFSVMTVDATTQPGFAGKPLIELNGAGAGDANGLAINAANGSTIKGLIINRFSRTGVLLFGAVNTFIQGNYIGTDAAGVADLGNAASGVVVVNSGANNTIGGTVAGVRNVISGNTGFAVRIDDSAGSGNIIRGNYIGTNATGTADLGNTNTGVDTLAMGTVIGGTTAGAGNVISGNNGGGVRIYQTTGTIVQGNLIGTQANGVTPLPNPFDGVFIEQSANDNVIGDAGPTPT